MFGTRLVSGIILVLLAVFLLVQGGLLLFLTSLAISLIGLFELYRVMKIEASLPGLIGYLAGPLLLRADLVWDRGPLYDAFSHRRFDASDVRLCGDLSQIRDGADHGGLFRDFLRRNHVFLLYQVSAMPDGKYLVWLIVLSSWGCDTCAYCAGMLLGKHKLAPVLSPKKTIEGAVGGVAGAALLGFLYGAYLKAA